MKMATGFFEFFVIVIFTQLCSLLTVFAVELPPTPDVDDLKGYKANAIVLTDNDALANINLSEYELRNDVFSGYNSWTRPRRNSLDTVEVYVGMTIFSIDDIIEKDHAFMITASFNTWWYDDFLVWNNTRYAPIESIVVGWNDVWTPDFASISDEMYTFGVAEGFEVNIDRDGKILYSPKCSFVTSCRFDLTYFPFDMQRCRVTFESWSYVPQQQLFKFDEQPFTLDKFTQHEQWTLFAITHYCYINCPPGAKGSQCNSGVRYNFILKRKSQFYNLNVIGPVTIVSITELATFTLPMGDPTKIHISFVCLLSYSIFQVEINKELPRTSDHPPLISIFLVMQMAYIALAIVGEGIALICVGLGRDKTPMPPSIQIFTEAVSYILKIHLADFDDEVRKAIDSEYSGRVRSKKSKNSKDELGLQSTTSATAEAIDFTIEQLPLLGDKGKYGAYLVERYAMTREEVAKIVAHARYGDDFEDDVGVPITDDVRNWFRLAVAASRFTLLLYIVLITITPLVTFVAVVETEPGHYWTIANNTNSSECLDLSNSTNETGDID